MSSFLYKPGRRKRYKPIKKEKIILEIIVQRKDISMANNQAWTGLLIITKVLKLGIKIQ